MKIQIIENEKFIDKADFENCEVWLLNRTTEGELDERIVNVSEITESLLPSSVKFPQLLSEIGNKYFIDDLIPEDFSYEILTNDKDKFIVRSYVCDEECIKVLSNS